MMAAVGLAAGAAACGGNGEGGGIDTTPPAKCSTNSTWTSGDEGFTMSPGGDCIGCHAQGEGPTFDIAGTVMKDSKDDTNCNGVGGVQVQITDANGQVLTLTANAAGNFTHSQHDGAVTFPITAKVISGGKEKAMETPQGTGACNSCHTAQGLNGAPGRITAP
jgi:hypothetical protein